MIFNAGGMPTIHSVNRRPVAIFFDVGETLIRPRVQYPELLTELSRELDCDLPAGALDGLSDRIEARVSERARQRLPFTFPLAESQRFWLETYRGYLARFLGGADALRLAHGLLDCLSSPAGYRVFDDTLATLEHLQADGIRLGIISNWESWLPVLLEGVGIARFFEHVVISGVCGLEKPDSRIFTHALSEGGYSPEDLLYIGDRPEHDVEPAREVGIRPVLLDRTNRYSHDFASLRIHSLSDLPLIIRDVRVKF